MATLVDATNPTAPNYTTGGSASESTGATAFNFNSSNNYVGFRFLNEGNGLVNYGWLQVSLGTSFTDSSRSIVGYAYETNGTGITVGNTSTATPEPSSLALLSIGAAGLAAYRRRRATA